MVTESRTLYAAAVRDHRAGRTAAAAAKYRAILARDPAHADALHMLGVIASGAGDAAAAFGFFETAASIAPSNAQFLNNLGVSARAIGRSDVAIKAFRAALSVDPGFYDARCNLGNALLDGGDAEAARGQYALALELEPTEVAARNGLARVCRLRGELDRAAELYAAVAAATPGDPAAHNNLGVVTAERGETAAAIEHYKKALDIDPNGLDVLNNLGVSLLAQGDTGSAEAVLRRLLARHPDAAVAHGNLGNALRRQGRSAAAASSYRRALALRPDPGLRIRLATLLPVIPTSRGALTRARREMEAAVDALLAEDIQIGDPMNDVGVTQFHLSYHDADNRGLNGKMARLYAKASPGLRYVAPHCRAPRGNAGGRLKVGFVSQYFRDHAVGWCYHGVLRLLPRDRFAVTAFTFRDHDDPLWRAIAADVDGAVVLPAGLAAARARIAQEELDVLVYTDIGMEPLTYFLAFARLAPVQCVTNGHPDTTGVPTLDYFVSSAPLEAPGAAGFYSETLAALDEALVYYDRPPRPRPLKPRAAFSLPDDATLYVCPQSLFKFHPDMDAALRRILSGDPRGRLIVFAGPEPNWAELLRQRWRRSLGGNIEQVQFLERQSYTDFLNILALGDVILDTWPFGGGNTAYQGLAMGTPIVTYPGRFARGRSTMALYRRLDIPEMIAESPADYAAIALRLGTDSAWRREIASRIETRADRLFADRAAVDAFARFLLRVGGGGEAAR